MTMYSNVCHDLCKYTGRDFISSLFLFEYYSYSVLKAFVIPGQLANLGLFVSSSSSPVALASSASQHSVAAPLSPIAPNCCTGYPPPVETHSSTASLCEAK